MQKIIKFFIVLTTVFLAKLLPFNWIVGSSGCMFSWTTMLAPVVAMQCSLSWVGCFFLSGKLLSMKSIWLFIAHRLPLLLAARTFVRSDLLISVIVPVFCMGLFIMHPVGGAAWLYAMYWLVPIGCYFMSQTMWSRALQASFVAHAVGSVVWLYTSSIPSSMWWSLIPVVAIERLMMAGGMVICNEVCRFCIKQFKYLLHKHPEYKVLR